MIKVGFIILYRTVLSNLKLDDILARFKAITTQEESYINLKILMRTAVNSKMAANQKIRIGL